ncbi:glycosyltransferase [Paenibacillus macquariensis subsp. defensor]|nr:glycosyltransferase [Paenibacillus macquariensis subsp. defensor]
MKIVMIGPMPPPIGGISIHIKRMVQRLEERGIACDVYNESHVLISQEGVYPIGSYKDFALKIPFMKGDLFHFHTISRTVRILLGFYKICGKKIILTVHGESLMDQITSSSALMRWLLLTSLRSIDQIVCVNEDNTKKLLALGFAQHKVVTVPSYIQPKEIEDDNVAIPNKVLEFMDKAKFVITANGYIRFYEDQDLYGVDLLIDLLKELTQRNKDVRIIFALLGVSSQSDEEKAYYDVLRKTITEFNLEDRFLFYEVENTEFYPIVKKSHLFIRPTVTDGYGVSIAEALYSSIPSIASDVCMRPEGTNLFQSRNGEDLLLKVQEIMEHYTEHKERVMSLSTKDYASDLLDIYQQIAGQRDPESNVILDECAK